MIGVIIQARMGAKRLPGKVLKQIDGQPLLKYQIERINRSKHVKCIVIATTTSMMDDPIAKFCHDSGLNCFRGDEQDVLSRYFECAKKFGIETIVRITADCPLIDPEIIDQTIDLFLKSESDFAANTVPPESSFFPDGSDVEVFSFKALNKAYYECKDEHFREHVTFYFWKVNNGFNTIQLKSERNLSQYRITVDYQEDFEVVEFIFKSIKKRNIFGNLNEIISILDKNPEIRKRNSRYFFGIGWNQ
jgi:spore coat polysaccharide biosynthesis protein SpsF